MQLTAEAPPPDSSESRGTARRALVAAWHNIGFLVYVIVLVYCVVGAFDPPRLNWGDSGSDYNVMIAGRNFQKYGFLNLRLTPLLLDRSVMTAADSIMIYTHYPQLPDLANGVLRTVFGMSDVVQFRFVALAFSFGALFFVYGLISTRWSRQTAQIALALWVSNSLWIQHADYLHHGPYGAFFGFGSVYFLARALQGDRKRAYLFASGAFLFLAYSSSYDYWIFAPLLLAMVTVAHFGGVFRREVVQTLGLLAGFAVAAILCKVATNAWALGGIGPFLRDLHFQSVERATDEVVHTGFATGIWPTLVGRVQRYFTLLLFPLAIFWAVLPLIRTRLANQLPALARPLVNPGLLLLAALPFLCLFPELWVAQYYPGLMVLPFYAVGFAALIVALLESGQRAMMAIGLAAFVGVMANALDEDVHFKKAFFERDAIRTLRAQLDSLAPPGQQVITNHVFDHAYRYYFDRNIVQLIVHAPFRIESDMAHFSDPRLPRFASPSGAIVVQHKHLTEELFDKGYYYVLARYRLWDAWADPRGYRRFIDSLIVERDSAISAQAAKIGEKLYESDFYVLWRIHHSPPAAARPSPAVPQVGR